MKNALAIIGVVAIVAVLGAVLVMFTGSYAIGADEPHWPMVHGAMQSFRMRAVRSAASSLQQPAFDDAMVRKGAREYAEMCVGCHLAPGAVDREMHDGLYPRPPEFTKARVEPREAFWTIKHGIKMSGMPAWGASHDDATIWAIVAFLQKLPEMSGAAYEELTSDTSAASMHGMAEGHSHAPGALPHMHTHK